MSLQLCPVCQELSFTWTMVDETLNSLTSWRCYTCNYSALEDERFERICKICKMKSEILLKDDELEYRWCGICNTKRPPIV